MREGMYVFAVTHSHLNLSCSVTGPRGPRQKQQRIRSTKQLRVKCGGVERWEHWPGSACTLKFMLVRAPACSEAGH